MLDFVLSQTDNYLNEKTKSERKRIGQFFTSKETAIYMASLFSIPNQSEISILDPGAGSGILSVALIEQLQKVVGLSFNTIDLLWKWFRYSYFVGKQSKVCERTFSHFSRVYDYYW